MTTEVRPTQVYIGCRDNMVAEVAAFDPTEIGIKSKACKYLILPTGEAQWDTQWSSNRVEALAMAKEHADFFNIPICWV